MFAPHSSMLGLWHNEDIWVAVEGVLFLWKCVSGYFSSIIVFEFKLCMTWDQKIFHFLSPKLSHMTSSQKWERPSSSQHRQVNETKRLSRLRKKNIWQGGSGKQGWVWRKDAWGKLQCEKMLNENTGKLKRSMHHMYI